MDGSAHLLEQPHLPGLVKPQCSPSPPAGAQRPGRFTRQTPSSLPGVLLIRLVNTAFSLAIRLELSLLIR